MGVGVEEITQAIEHYAALGLYDAADRAAGEDPILRQRVENAYSLPRSHFLAQFGDLLDDARAASDPEINEYLAVMLTELDRRNLSEAAAWVDVLRDLVVRNRRLADPERNALVALILESGVTVSDDSTIEELHAELQRIRSENQNRRLHVKALLDAIEGGGLPEVFRSRCCELGNSLDRPALWPSELVSMRLATAIATILRVFEVSGSTVTAIPRC